MKLYYAPGACSLSPHIVAREGKIAIELSRVTFDGAKRTTAEGEDFFVVNPKGGYVPALRLDSGDVLSEGVAIIHYLVDQSSVTLMPEKGSLVYYRALEWMTYISSEIHKGFSPLFNPTLSDELKGQTKEKIMSRLAYVESELGKHQYLVGDSFTAPDAYLYTILRWTKQFGMSLEEYANITAYMARVESREAVKQALKEEGLETFYV
ncbi:MAG: gst [Candidatus Nomurabacteria bacterium]|nr:gst [Candidatus Nomurabacteria bacterium]